MKAVGVKLSRLNLLKENGFITEPEYDNSIKHINARKKPNASGDPDPGSGTGAASPGAVHPPAPCRKLDREDEEWVRANAKPKVTRCTITHVVNDEVKKWTVKYPLCKSRSRNYGDDLDEGGRTCLEALNHCLHYAWTEHRKATGEECPWNLTPRCD